MNDLLKYCIGQGFLVDKDTLEFFKDFELDIAKEILEKINGLLHQRVITKSFFVKNINQIKEIIPLLKEDSQKTVEKLLINLGVQIEITRVSEKRKKDTNINSIKPVLSNVKVLSSSPQKSRKITVPDFVKHFRNRFSQIRNLLQDRKELNNLVSISKLGKDKRGISIIGIVLSKRITQNKNIFLTVEDLTGRINVIVNKNKEEAYEKAKEVLLDDVIGIKCSGNMDILFANDIVYPDSRIHEPHRLEREEYVAFISDIHVGSTMFLEDNFKNFVSWINGESGDISNKEIAKKIKYLFITGDLVDGVGVFPGQEDFLKIKDIRFQYEKFVEIISELRDDLSLIICPGQHDASRVAEPQPPISENYAPSLYTLKNSVFVSNPSLIEIGASQENRGFKVLMYHGASFHGIVNEIERLRINRGHDTPTKIMKELLKRRHLSPMHSANPYIPGEKEDSHVIKEVPDIVVNGDLHRAEIELYNNIFVVAGSCWQSKTPFEEKVGNNPDPCKVPVINLKTREAKILDFS